MKIRVKYDDYRYDKFIISEEIKQLIKSMMEYREEDRP